MISIHYLMEKKYSYAGDIAEGAKMPKIAILNYVKADEFSSAEGLAKKEHLVQYLRQVCRDHIQFHLQRRDGRAPFLPAAEAAELAGNYELAIQYFIRSDHPPSIERARELAEERGLTHLMSLARPAYKRMMRETEKNIRRFVKGPVNAEAFARGHAEAAAYAHCANLPSKERYHKRGAQIHGLIEAEQKGDFSVALKIASELGLESRVRALQTLLQPPVLKHA